ncbi:hypothetical protein MLP_09060 [Microlunatus phosphovorus NM-1]|uniref:Uncharacterized protein n=1 Tax=Microlunatus phosphovorus (strain ATCC 700054 / DSM 10555 / JCM 9379 / NBRC 101784 / NCIMB 13414 / VKM Ac-1990 / NM-1) TaxID=1032480 RepID=F5XM41_MICPN|nr:hypothetical protein [Microlunatus phosphovorus]BAK33920.1 hypothetical protein MLP_09060 [Microlunatus phosphovorus NM-1]
MASYTVKAVKFKAVDESGIDWTGSDEPLWVFTANAGGRVTTSRSREFGDVDSGETFNFDATGNKNTVWPVARDTKGAPGPIALAIQLWEMDQGNPDDVAKKTEKALNLAQWAPVIGDWVGKARGVIRDSLNNLIADDLMGSRTVLWSARTLERRLPRPGASFEERFRFSGKSGDLPFDVAGGPDYDLWVRVRRIS